MTDPRYPIGPFAFAGPPDEATRNRMIEEIAAAPRALLDAVSGLSPAQLETPYRPSGWTVRQVVHHLPDSHMNSLVRFKLALTEDRPTIKPYDEARWAELADGKTAPVETSLGLLEHLHDRWVMLLRSITPDEWTRTFVHPEHGAVTLDWALGMYAWHGRHHVAHITSLSERMGWA